MLKTDLRHTLPRRLTRGTVKACVAVGALVGAANWAAKGYPPPAQAPATAAVAARAPLPLDEPVTTGSIVPRGDAKQAKAAEKPAPEKIVARVPDFDSRALAALAAGTTPAQAGTPPVRREAARKDAARQDTSRKDADQARR
jgi:hypothetical protein